MTDLSPAAQAVLTAFGTHPLRANHIAEDLVPALAAALRAAADQCQVQWNYHPDYPETESVVVVSDLLAIAAELEGSNV